MAFLMKDMVETTYEYNGKKRFKIRNFIALNKAANKHTKWPELNPRCFL